MIQTSGLDEKTAIVSDTLVPLPEPEAIGTTPNEDMTKLGSIKETDEEGPTEHELHLLREEEKYTLYIGTLSPQESDMESEMDKSEHQFYE